MQQAHFMKRLSLLFFSLLLPCCSFAIDACEWTMTSSAGLGYRSDRQTFEENLSLSHLNHLDSLQATVNLSFAWERLILRVVGDYNWILNGHLSFKGFPPLFQPPFERFASFSIHDGYITDVQPLLGCRIKFWTFPCGSLSFIPGLGFNYSHFNACPTNQKTSPLPSSAGFTTLQYTKPLQQDWFGPLVELRLALSWKDQFRLDWFYQYTHVDYRQTYQQVLSHYFLNGAGDLIAADTSRISISSKGNNLRTQLGGFDFSYTSNHHWQLGTHFEGSSTWSNTAKSLVRITTDSFTPTFTETKTKLTERQIVRWTRYIVNFYASYWF